MTPLRLLTPEQWEAKRAAAGWWTVGGLEVGDMTFAAWYVDQGWTGILSPEYKQSWLGKRPPLMCVLPGPEIHCLDFRAHDRDGNLLEHGWTVTGEPPRITVAPSIDLSMGGKRPGWHGWIRDGHIT